MSGHNKWSTIKHKKGKEDAKRGKIFTKLIRELTTAARQGGGDPDGNPRLRAAISAAKSANMPSDNVTRAIKKGTGELEGASYEEANYEGYGPGGVAVLVECLTDNKNRTVAEIRHTFSKYGGNMGENGCVSWMFDTRGLIVVNAEGVDEEEIMMVALEAGAEDLSREGETFEVLTQQNDVEAVRAAIEEGGYTIESAEVAKIPQNTTKVEGKHVSSLLKMLDLLEDCDDVQRVWSNPDIDDDALDAAN